LFCCGRCKELARLARPGSRHVGPALLASGAALDKGASSALRLTKALKIPQNLRDEKQGKL